MNNHPLVRSIRAPLATPPIETLATHIISAIEGEYRGIVIHGMARFGKSWAIRYLIELAMWAPHSAYLTKVGIPKNHKRVDGAFFSLFLENFDLKLPERCSALDRLHRLRNRIIERCNEHGTNLCIIFMDEAQRLFPDDYEHLCTLDNEMTDRGYMLFVVFVHQSDFTSAVNERIYEGNPPPHVWKRFLMRHHVFKGLADSKAVEYVLNRYDECTEYPPGSGISYTKAFAEEAFSSGWRLTHHAEQLYAHAERLRRENKLPSPWTWPMKSFELCVNYLLTNIAKARKAFTGFSEDDIAKALFVSGFLEMELNRHTWSNED
ncbi:ATP-binding protein [Dokdonella sp. MW10]|uniref:ATP-binding protein n=1 Tax=Dokdonella sp. MW10 TaxID=2992926 RepID=UPI003F7CF106